MAPPSEPPRRGSVDFVPEAATAAKVLEVASRRASAGRAGAMATVLERHGSAPSTPGQKLYVCDDGTSVGTVGGGAVEREVLAALATFLSDPPPRPEVRELRLGAELGMCCGGRVSVLLEPIAGLVSCLVVGGGHVATATAPLLARLGFAVTVVDERDAWGEDGRLAGVTSLVGAYDELGAAVPSRGVLLVMTHDHQADQRAIEWAPAAGVRARRRRREPREGRAHAPAPAPPRLLGGRRGARAHAGRLAHRGAPPRRDRRVDRGGARRVSPRAGAPLRGTGPASRAYSPQASGCSPTSTPSGSSDRTVVPLGVPDWPVSMCQWLR